MTGSELRRLRRDHDLTQAEVAEHLGVRRERITYLEALSRVPPRAADSVTAAIREAAAANPSAETPAPVGILSAVEILSQAVASGARQ